MTITVSRAMIGPASAALSVQEGRASRGRKGVTRWREATDASNPDRRDWENERCQMMELGPSQGLR